MRNDTVDAKKLRTSGSAASDLQEIRGHRDNNQEDGELLSTAALVLIPPSWPAG